MNGFRRIASCSACLVLLSLGLACGGKKPASSKPPDLDVTGKIRLAQAQVKAGRVSEALETLQGAIRDEPSNAGLRNYYGQVCFLTGRHEEAETAFRKALEADPYMTDAHNNLGALYDKTGRKSEAEAEYRLALEDPAYPTPEKVHLNLGLLYSSQGRTDDAIGSFRNAVEINPKYYEAHFELASILDRNDKLTEAARLYEVAAPGFRGDGEYHYRLGFAYYRIGEKLKAREHLNRVLEVAPGSHNAVRASELLDTMD
jgi:Tfp pilus assembly protein PilF